MFNGLRTKVGGNAKNENTGVYENVSQYEYHHRKIP